MMNTSKRKLRNGFRLLTGINFNRMYVMRLSQKMSFRPLTGINFNYMPHSQKQSVSSFRPLTGINFNAGIEYPLESAIKFPSPHGDKFQQLN